jgi:hypothetical protein
MLDEAGILGSERVADGDAGDRRAHLRLACGP